MKRYTSAKIPGQIVYLPPGTPDGPMHPGATEDFKNHVSAIVSPAKIPTKVDVGVAYVILADNTVIGDAKRANTYFFEPNKAQAALYARHMGELNQIDQSAPDTVKKAFAALQQSWTAAPSPTSTDPRVSLANRLATLVIQSDLRGAMDMLKHGRDATDTFKSQMALVKAQYDRVVQHSAPKGN